MESSGTRCSSMSEFNVYMESGVSWHGENLRWLRRHTGRLVSSAMPAMLDARLIRALLWELSIAESGFSDQAADLDGPKAAGTRHFCGAPHALWLQAGSLGHEGTDFVSGAALCDTCKVQDTPGLEKLICGSNKMSELKALGIALLRDSGVIVCH